MIAASLCLLRDERGVVAPIVAILGLALIGSAALALDVGLYFSGSKALTSATQAAALSAAIDPTNAQTRAQTYLVANGYPASAVKSVQVGRYCPDVSLASTARFYPSGTTSPCPGNGLSNAVRLQTSLPAQQYATAWLGNTSPMSALSATATAARIDEAGVEMTTGALTLNVGIVNQLLTALTGSNIALNGAQLQALLGNEIDAGIFFDKLAARVHQTGTYGALTSQTVTMADILGAAADTSTASGASTTAAALTTLSGQIGGAIPVPLDHLFDLGVWENIPVGGSDAPTGLRAGLNVYQLVAYALQTNGRSAQINGLNVGVAGIASIQLVGTASGIDPTKGSAAGVRFGFGPSGETAVYTALTRILLNVKIADLGALLSSSPLLGSLLKVLIAPLLNGVNVQIPLLIEVGAGSASISQISCGQEAKTDSTVQIAGSSGLLSAYIGSPLAGALTQPFTPVSVSSASLVPLLLTAKATVGPGFGASRSLLFNRTSGGDGIIGQPPSGGTPARINNGSQLGPLLTSLGSNLQLTLLGALNISGLLAPLTTILGNLIGALGVDPLLDSLLAGLGIQPGYADVWVTGVRCGVPVLV